VNIIQNSQPLHNNFYEEKVVFARSLWYIAFFGPSEKCKIKINSKQVGRNNTKGQELT